MEELKTQKMVQTPKDVLQRVGAMVRRMLRFGMVIAIAAGIGLLTAVLTPLVIPPVYESETVVLYREVIQTENLLGSQQYQTESGRQVGQRLREMLMSRTNLQKILEQHKLYQDIVDSRGIIDAVETFRNKIDCKVREGETFTIRYQGEDAALVFNVTKTLAESLVQANKQYRIEQAESTKQFLELEEKRTSAELREKEQGLAEFLAGHPEFAQDNAAGTQASAGASVRAAARSSAAAASSLGAGIQALERQAARLRQQIANPAAPIPTPVAGLPPDVAAAMAEADSALAEAQRELASRQAQYTAQHPDVVAAQAAVRSAQAKVNETRARARPIGADPTPIPRNEEARVEQLRAQLRQVESSIIRARRGDASAIDTPSDESTRIVALETQWAAINRELEEVRVRYQQIQSRLFRASIVASVEASGRASKMVVVDPAYEPNRPARRGAKRTGAVAFVVVLLLGIGVATALGLVDDRVYDEHDLRKLELGPIVHVVPSDAETGAKGKKHV